MKSRKIKYLATGATVLLLVAGICAIMLLQNRIADARAENASLQASQSEMQQLQTENAGLEQLRSANEQVAQFKLANKDLPRLRNQIRQLRGQAAEVAKLETENQRLAASHNQTSTVPENFISRSALRNLGCGSPEAAIETYFYYATTGDVQGMAQCTVGGQKQPFSNDQSKRLQKDFENFPGFSIVEKNEVSADKVVLTVQAMAGGKTQTLVLARLQDGWKLAGY